uniref:cytochrome c oxidase subunit 2 n=1 Tax=Arthurdendyus triangulatus TaxID=132421 RepID=UPI002E7A6E98|nr:cytochrome c oxidase subunit 2 [Arthurdendyus triangulatus]WPY71418.1 cytochrome c oxidase subunit 2 [Arthurdendyus triangulatus]
MHYSLLNSHTIIGKKLDLFHDFSLFVLIFICLFVFGLLVIFWVNSWVFDNFIESKVTEFLWTSFPGIILVFLLIPSIHGLYNLDYIRLVRVKLNSVVSGRQWYWSFKFLPQTNKVSVCPDCEHYFGMAEKSHFWFNSSLDISNLVLPFWGGKLNKTLDSKEYWVSPLGVSQEFQLPEFTMKLLSYNTTEDSEEARISLGGVSPTIEHRSMSFHPMSVELAAAGDAFENLYRDSLFWGHPSLTRKVNFFYDVDSYLAVGAAGILRNLDSETPLVLPVRKLIRFFFWSSDVIHSFAIPELSLKLDCVPGRLNSAFVLIRHVGKYFGQCSEICGANHSFMPASIETYFQPSLVCLGKHYYTDYDYYWNSKFYYRTTFVRIWGGLFGFFIMKILSPFGLMMDVQFEECVPSVLCPGCVWFWNWLSSWWGGSVVPLDVECKLGFVGEKKWG